MRQSGKTCAVPQYVPHLILPFKAAFSISSSVTVFWRLCSACIPPWTKCPRLELFSSFSRLISRLRFCTLFWYSLILLTSPCWKTFCISLKPLNPKLLANRIITWRRNFRMSSDYGNCFHSHFVGVTHGAAGYLLKMPAQNAVAFNQFISQVFIIHFPSSFPDQIWVSILTSLVLLTGF